jgi:cysteine synthase A
MRNALQLVGNTPLLELDNGIFAKLESINPSGSIKDRMVKFMVEQAEKRGELKKGSTIVEATSGNTGIALSMIGKLKGYNVKIFMPKHMSEERKRMMKYFGATLVLTGSMEEAMGKAGEEAKKENTFLLNQFKNGDNIEAHRIGTGREIAEQLNKKIDYFVAGIGTGGTIMGAGRTIKEKNPNARIIGVLPKDKEDNKIEGIGSYYRKEIVEEKFLDEILLISNKEAIDAARGLAKHFGLLVGPSSGANYAAAKKLNGTIATILPDSANRYLSTKLFQQE